MRLPDLDVATFLRALTPGNYCLITHRNADLDAIASALTLRQVIAELTSSDGVYVVVPEGLDATSKFFLSNLSIKLDHLYDDEKFDKCCEHYVVVDAASRDQLGSFTNIKDFILVDHHEVNTLIDSAGVTLYDYRRKSASEIVAHVVISAGVGLNSDYLTLLIGGILHDSRFLYLADEITFEILAGLMRLGGNYGRARELLSRRAPMSYSEKVARLKAMSRLGIYKAGKYLVTVTCIGAYEGNVLKDLLEGGADISIALARRGEGFRVTVRVREEVVNELGKPLAGLLTSHLADSLGGSGGGHSLAGGSYIQCKDPDKVLKTIESFFKVVSGNFKTIDEGRWLEECS